jgi:hypothetical protein
MAAAADLPQDAVIVKKILESMASESTQPGSSGCW